MESMTRVFGSGRKERTRTKAPKLGCTGTEGLESHTQVAYDF